MGNGVLIASIFFGIVLVTVLAIGGYYLFNQQSQAPAVAAAKTETTATDASVAALEAEALRKQLEQELIALQEKQAAEAAAVSASQTAAEAAAAQAEADAAAAKIAADLEAAKLEEERLKQEAEAAAAAAAAAAKAKREADIATALKIASSTATDGINEANYVIKTGVEISNNDVSNGGLRDITAQYDLAELALVYKSKVDGPDTAHRYGYVKGNVIDANTVDFQMNVVETVSQTLVRVDAIRVTFQRLGDYQIRAVSDGGPGSGLTVLPDITSQFGPDQLWPPAKAYYRLSSEYPSNATGVTYIAGKSVDPVTVDYLFRVPFTMNGVQKMGVEQNRRFVFVRQSNGSYTVKSMGPVGSGTAVSTSMDYSDITAIYPCSSATTQGIVTNYWTAQNPGKTIDITKVASVDKVSCDYLFSVFEGTRQISFENRRFTYQLSATTPISVKFMGAIGSGLLTPPPPPVSFNSNYTIKPTEVLFSGTVNGVIKYPKSTATGSIVLAGSSSTDLTAMADKTIMKWTVESAGTGLYYLRTMNGTYLYASADFLVRPGAKSSNNEFKWRIGAQNGSFAIQNVKFGNFMGIDYHTLPGSTFNSYFLSMKNLGPVYVWKEVKPSSILVSAPTAASTMTSETYSFDETKEYIIKYGLYSLMVNTSGTTNYTTKIVNLGTVTSVPSNYKWKFRKVPNQVNTYVIQSSYIPDLYLHVYNTSYVYATKIALPDLNYAWEIAKQSGQFVFKNRATGKFMRPSTSVMSAGTSGSLYTVTDTSLPTAPTYSSTNPAPPRTDNRCGPSYGNAKCSPGNCCSSSGTCGNTDAYCVTTYSAYNGDNAPAVSPDRIDSLSKIVESTTYRLVTVTGAYNISAYTTVYPPRWIASSTTNYVGLRFVPVTGESGMYYIRENANTNYHLYVPNSTQTSGITVSPSVPTWTEDNYKWKVAMVSSGVFTLTNKKYPNITLGRNTQNSYVYVVGYVGGYKWNIYKVADVPIPLSKTMYSYTSPPATTTTTTTTTTTSTATTTAATTREFADGTYRIMASTCNTSYLNYLVFNYTLTSVIDLGSSINTVSLLAGSAYNTYYIVKDSRYLTISSSGVVRAEIDKTKASQWTITKDATTGKYTILAYGKNPYTGAKVTYYLRSSLCNALVNQYPKPDWKITKV